MILAHTLYPSNIADLAKQVLVGWLTGNKQRRCLFVDGVLDSGSMPKSTMFHIILDPSVPDEKLALDYLKTIPAGYRNKYIKVIMRYFIQPPSGMLYNSASKSVTVFT